MFWKFLSYCPFIFFRWTVILAKSLVDLPQLRMLFIFFLNFFVLDSNFWILPIILVFVKLKSFFKNYLEWGMYVRFFTIHLDESLLVHFAMKIFVNFFRGKQLSLQQHLQLQQHQLHLHQMHRKIKPLIHSVIGKRMSLFYFFLIFLIRYRKIRKKTEKRLEFHLHYS